MIEIQRIVKSFPQRGGGKFEALRDVNLTVNDNEFLGIIGPSGCGKTTLLKMLGGLDDPDDGEISINGQRVSGPGPDRAIVFQSFVLLPWSNVLSNVTFGLEMRGVPKKEARKIALREIERVGLSRFERHFPHELSGGMQQRVGLARALAVNPDILLMDEPFASVDAQTRTLLQDDLLKIWDGERTVVFVTHSMEEAVYLSDRVVVMDRSPGRIKEIIDIPFARPRDDSMRRTAEFGELTGHIWDSLRMSLTRNGEDPES